MINAALENQLEDIRDMLDSLQLLSGDNHTQMLNELKTCAPRLANLARSESLSQELMSRVLELNDRVLQVIRETASEASVQEQKVTKTFKPFKRETQTLYIDTLQVNGKTYARVLNHSPSMLSDVVISDGQQNIGHADFLAQNETMTTLLGADFKSGLLTYKGLPNPIQFDSEQ